MPRPGGSLNLGAPSLCLGAAAGAARDHPILHRRTGPDAHRQAPYAHFEGNDYNLLRTQVHRTLTLLASPGEVCLLDGADEITRHPRCYRKGQQIERPTYIEAPVQIKRRARTA